MSKKRLHNIFNKYSKQVEKPDFEKFKAEHKYENGYYTSEGTFGSERFINDTKEHIDENIKDNLKSIIIGKMILPSKPRYKYTVDKYKVFNNKSEFKHNKTISKEYKDINKCNNKTNLIGEKLNDNVIVIILPLNNKYIAYCYEQREIRNIFNPPDNIYEYNDSNRIYKEPYSGIYLDNQSKDLIKTYNTFIAKSLNEKVYRLYPISRLKFLSSEKITDNDIIL